MISAIDSYWQEKTLKVAISSFRFYFAAIALLLYLTKKDFQWIIKAIALLAVFWSLDALFQYFVGFDIIGRASYDGRLNGIFGEHHVKLGPVLALLLPIVMIAFKQQKSIFRWLTVLLIVVVVALTGTRSAWLMVAFTLFAYWFHHVKQRRFQLLLKGLLASTVLLLGLWFISSDFQNRVQRTLAALQGTEKGVDFALADRLPIWQTSLQMIQSHPINGVGAHAFRKAYSEFAESDDVWQSKGGVGMHAHHWVLEVLAETGFIGFILFLIAIIKLSLYLKNNYHKDYSWAYLLALISAFLPFTSTYSIFASFWSLCIWFIGAGLISVSYTQELSVVIKDEKDE
jgi:O-antigen ligase